MKLERKEYICDICKQIFLKRRYFVQHLRRHNSGDSDRGENASNLIDLLPRNWKYIIKSYEPQAQNKNFTAAIFALELCTADQVKEWVKEFMNINKCNYILKHLDTRESRYAKSKHVYMCRYLNRKSNKSSCQSCIRVIIKRNWENSAYFAAINLKYVHNHSPDCAAILRYRTPNEDVQQYFRNMFENGYSPSQAFNSYKQHLYAKYPSKYNSVIADRGVCPDQRWVYYFYQKILKEKNGPSQTEQMITTVRSSVEEFNVTYKDSTCQFTRINDQHFSITLMTPLMKRALSTLTSSKVIFINYESDISRFGLHVFILYTSCYAVGGIPIGVIMTSTNTEDVISTAFRHFHSVSSETSSTDLGATILVPSIIIIDDLIPLRNALETVFPESCVFLSIFHILESSWKWLWKVENSVDSKFRKPFYNYLQRLTFCSQPELLEIIFADMLSYGNAQSHKKFVDYVTGVYNRRHEWCMCLREKLPIERQYIKDVIESTMNVFKEKVFKKLKAYNPGQFFNYIVEDFNTHYKKKLIDIVVNENYNYMSQRMTISEEQLAKYRVESVTDSVVLLSNTKKGTNYVVNKDVGACSCYLGEAGLFCKHLVIINYYFELNNDMRQRIDVEQKKQFYYTATGSEYSVQNFDGQDVDAELIKVEEKMECCDAMSEDVIEEVVLMLEDQEENSESEVKVVNLTRADVTGYEQDVKEFRMNLKTITSRVSSNLPMFGEGLKCMNQILRTLTKEPDSVLLSTLMSFANTNVKGNE